MNNGPRVLVPLKTLFTSRGQRTQPLKECVRPNCDLGRGAPANALRLTQHDPDKSPLDPYARSDFPDVKISRLPSSLEKTFLYPIS